MLTRCGIGKLILFDYDTVELANMNRLFFKVTKQRHMLLLLLLLYVIHRDQLFCVAAGSGGHDENGCVEADVV